MTGQGGGFGSPPGGAPPGGGGFGSPPGGAPPGGGGFGSPPGGAPPGGGGFGSPPGGAPPGGGGFGSAPPGGGPAFGSAPAGGPPPSGPLTHIPFTPEEESNLSGAALWMMLSAVVAFISVFTALIKVAVTSWATWEVAQEAAIGNLIGGACGGVIGIIFTGLFGAWLILGSRALKKVVETNDNDQVYLVEAIDRLRQVFALKAVALVSIFLIMCLVGLLVGGATVAAAGNL